MMQSTTRVVIPNTYSDLQWFESTPARLAKKSNQLTCERTFSKHEHVYMEGESKRYVYLVLAGVVGTYKAQLDGRRQIISFASEGDIVGFDYLDFYSDNAQAFSNVQLRCISVSAIDELMGIDPEFSRNMLRMTSLELIKTREQLLSLGCQSAMEKLANFLLQFCRINHSRGKKPNKIHLPMTRRDIADYLGLTIETVSRKFTLMRTLGVIQLLSNTEILVIDRLKLEGISGR
ncbi:MAG: CRP/FNR family transcriptional regulator [Candidatus Azotimanducaceae bacterium]|jgi:CRP/FNR family transcriptional regulator